MVKGKNKYGLTPLQEAYCHEYVIDKNGSRAARRAGSKAKQTRRTAEYMMKNPLILRRIEQLMASQLAKTDITAELVLNELRAIATSDLAAFFAEDGALLPLHKIPAESRRTISSIEVEERQASGYPVRKVRLWDKLRALELLGKHLKLFHEMGELRLSVEPKKLKTIPEINAEIARLRELMASGEAS